MTEASATFARSQRPTITARLLAFGLVSLYLSSVAAFPSDDWKNKDPQAWDQKDVQKILNDSPWAKQLQFGIAPDGSLSSNVASVGSSGISEISGPASGGTKGGVGNGAGPYPGTGSQAPVAATASTPLTKFTVCWRSSVTVREALVREKELAHLLPDAARRELAAKYDSYQVAISGGDLRAFSRESAEALKTRSYLLARSAKQIIQPSNIVVETRPDGSVLAVVFEFPKKSAAGEPTIAPNEKSVEFGTKVSGMPIKTIFEISKMSVNGAPDL
jgi:hypothetical protein